MILAKRGRGRRSAFTLIELLVVIAIIAILVALTGAAVMRALVKGPELQTNSEINLLTSKLAGVQKDLAIPVLPSHLRLREDNNYVSGNAAIQADYNLTKAALQQAFGKHICDPGTYVDWTGNGPGADHADLVLEGEQCLVFWLGGQPKQGAGTIGMVGFPPQVQGGATEKRGPFYEFLPARLKMFTAPGSALAFPVYIDAWGQGQPYLFFASYRTEGAGLYQADCPSFGVTPYVDPSGKFLNSTSFQIISAGRDGKFGAGGNTWNSNTGTTAANGQDDQSNFSPHLLGAPAN